MRERMEKAAKFGQEAWPGGINVISNVTNGQNSVRIAARPTVTAAESCCLPRRTLRNEPKTGCEKSSKSNAAALPNLEKAKSPFHCRLRSDPSRNRLGSAGVI